MPPTTGEEQTAVNNVWASKAQRSDETFSLTLPSGQVCRVKKVDIMDLLATGLLRHFDVLSSLMDEGPIKAGKDKLQGHKGKAKAKDDDNKLIKKIMADPSVIGAMVGMADLIAPRACVEPRVAIHYDPMDDSRTPIPADDREDGIIYTDQIDFMDKIEIMNECVDGMEDLSQFRS